MARNRLIGVSPLAERFGTLKAIQCAVFEHQRFDGETQPPPCRTTLWRNWLCSSSNTRPFSGSTRSNDSELASNLKTLFGLGHVPCVTTVHERLDKVSPESLRFAFKSTLAQLQRGKGLEQKASTARVGDCID